MAGQGRACEPERGPRRQPLRIHLGRVARGPGFPGVAGERRRSSGRNSRGKARAHRHQRRQRARCVPIRRQDRRGRGRLDRLQAAHARPQAGREGESTVCLARPRRRPASRARDAGPGTGRTFALVQWPRRGAGRIRREARRAAARARPAVGLAAPFRYGDARAARRGRGRVGALGGRGSVAGGRVLRATLCIRQSLAAPRRKPARAAAARSLAHRRLLRRSGDRRGNPGNEGSREGASRVHQRSVRDRSRTSGGLAMIRKRGVALLFALVCAGHGAAVLAQVYPSRPPRLIVGFTPGGGVDINARVLASKLSELLPQQVIVENRPGAGTNIANEYVAKSAPDGYTLLFNSPAVVINMSLYRNPPYDALRDFAGVSVFSESTNILVVSASLSAGSLEELVALARERPGALNYSSAGAGSTQHLAAELFKLRSGTSIVHVPYKGSAPSIAALLAGEVQLSFINPVAVGPHVKSGRLRALGVAGAKRTELMPEVPTMKEAGVEVPLWFGMLAPAATPRETVNTLAAAVIKAAKSPDTRKRLLEQGAEAVGSTPEEFSAMLKEEVARWAEVVRISGARAD